MKIILLLKQLLNYYLKMFGNFIAFYYCLLQIKTLGLFQEFEKISVKSLVFQLAYLYFFT